MLTFASDVLKKDKGKRKKKINKNKNNKIVTRKKRRRIFEPLAFIEKRSIVGLSNIGSQIQTCLSLIVKVKIKLCKIQKQPPMVFYIKRCS